MKPHQPADHSCEHDPALRLAQAELEHLRAPRREAETSRSCRQVAAPPAGFRGCGQQASGPSDLAVEPTSPLGLADCAAYPLGNFRTNNNFIFLREILQISEGEPPVDPVEAGVCLKNWLLATAANTQLPNGQYAGASGSGVLVIDQMVELTEPIRIPKQLTLSGVGKQGAGALRFRGLPPGTKAITFQPSYVDPVTDIAQPSYVSIQDLRIYYSGPKNSIGIAIDTVGDVVYLRRVAMSNWQQAILNNHGYSVIIEQCDLAGNSYHVTAGFTANAMRIRECRLTGATGAGISLNFLPGLIPVGIQANSCLITGCRFAQNQYGIFVDRHISATIVGNSFVGNTGGNGIYVTNNARQARIIGNYFDGGDIFRFQQQDTALVVTTGHHQWGFNTVAGNIEADVRARLEGLYVERIYTGVFNELM